MALEGGWSETKENVAMRTTNRNLGLEVPDSVVLFDALDDTVLPRQELNV